MWLSNNKDHGGPVWWKNFAPKMTGAPNKFYHR
jgi:hypothetical protein